LHAWFETLKKENITARQTRQAHLSKMKVGPTEPLDGG
jgi:hypothetical protein